MQQNSPFSIHRGRTGGGDDSQTCFPLSLSAPVWQSLWQKYSRPLIANISNSTQKRVSGPHRDILNLKPIFDVWRHINRTHLFMSHMRVSVWCVLFVCSRCFLFVTHRLPSRIVSVAYQQCLEVSATLQDNIYVYIIEKRCERTDSLLLNCSSRNFLRQRAPYQIVSWASWPDACVRVAYNVRGAFWHTACPAKYSIAVRSIRHINSWEIGFPSGFGWN